MLKQFSLLLILALLPLSAALAQYSDALPQGKDYYPWEGSTAKYCAYYEIFDGAMFQYYPAEGIVLTPSVYAKDGSGFHAHPDNSPRPVPTVVFSSTGGNVTDTLGCVSFTWATFDFSGWYSIVVTPPPNTPFKTYATKHHVWYHDLTLNGSPVPLVPYDDAAALAINQTFQQHYDGRHSGNSSIDNSRYGEAMSAQLAFEISQDFKVAMIGIPSLGAQVLDLIRGSLPEGGNADNERTSQAYGPYIFNEWFARKGEKHDSGVEWDFANPLGLDGNPIRPFVFENIVEMVGCRLGKVDQSGVPLSNPNGPTGFWATQGVEHVVCSEHPSSVH
jgi:hypothetical protein